MNRRKFLKSMFIFTGALWIPKYGIARMSPAIVGGSPSGVPCTQWKIMTTDDTYLTIGEWNTGSQYFSNTSGNEVCKVIFKVENGGTGSYCNISIWSGANQSGTQYGSTESPDVPASSTTWVQTTFVTNPEPPGAFHVCFEPAVNLSLRRSSGNVLADSTAYNGVTELAYDFCIEVWTI